MGFSTDAIPFFIRIIYLLIAYDLSAFIVSYTFSNTSREGVSLYVFK